MDCWRNNADNHQKQKKVAVFHFMRVLILPVVVKWVNTQISVIFLTEK